MLLLLFLCDGMNSRIPRLVVGQIELLEWSLAATSA